MKQLRINPVYKKELKISMRTIKVALTLLAYNGLLAVIGLIAFYAVFQNARYGGINYEDILMLYALLTAMEFGMILFVIPAYTSSAISGERERQTLEILLTTSMKPIQIIWGKLLSSISTVLLLVFSSLPVLSLVFTIGGVSVGDLAKYVVMIVVTAVFAGSIGLLFSVLFKRTTISTVFTYGALLVVGLGTIVVLLVIYLLLQQYYDVQYNVGNYAQYRSPDLGFGVCLLYINPGLTIVALLLDQFSGMGEFTDLIEEFGTIPQFMTTYWFWISLAVQTAASAGILCLAAKILNPLRRKKEKKRGRRKTRGARNGSTSVE